MKEASFQSLRDDRHSAGDFAITRETYVHDGGHVTQEFTLADKETLMVGAQWDFQPQGSHDGTLKVLDHHWEKIGTEMKAVEALVRDYARVKLGDDKEPSVFVKRSVMRDMSGLMFSQNMSDEECQKGVCNETYFPTTLISERLDAIRNAYRNENQNTARMDNFEKVLFGITLRLQKAEDIFDRATGDPEHNGGGLQGTAGESEYDDDKSWRGNTPSGGKGGKKRKLQPWEDDNYDPDDKRDNKLYKLMQQYHASVIRFENAANRLWMDAVGQVMEKAPVTANEVELAKMRELMVKAAGIYEKLKDATQDSGVMFELKPFHEKIEDPEKGMGARMQKAISMAARPQELEKIIRAGLSRPKERE